MYVPKARKTKSMHSVANATQRATLDTRKTCTHGLHVRIDGHAPALETYLGVAAWNLSTFFIIWVKRVVTFFTLALNFFASLRAPPYRSTLEAHVSLGTHKKSKELI